MPKKSDENLSKLKEDVLNSVLNNLPFQQKNINLNFADLPFILAQPVVYLVDKDVKNNLNIDKLNKPIEIVTEEFLKKNPDKSGNTVFLKFNTTKQAPDTILLSLDAKNYSSNDERISNVSSMQITFKKDGNSWEILDEPTSLSA